MSSPRRFATLSKYPPYHSGHARQALWNNQALAAATGCEQHQVTYCGISPDPADDAGPGVIVHHARAASPTRRLPDGGMMRSAAGELYRAARGGGADAILTYYVDPHAEVANRVADALARSGPRPLLLHSVEGSDLLDSMHEHLDDGGAALLIGDTLKADVICAVSEYAADRFRAAADAVSGVSSPPLPDVHVRYPGLPPAAFAVPAARDLHEFRMRHGLRPDSRVVSTFGRLEEEKGLDTVIRLAELTGQDTPGLEFVIAGAGSIEENLAKQAAILSNLTVLRGIGAYEAQCLRAVSAAALFPGKVVPGFTETFCVSALEYQALGVPVLVSRAGGVAEATPGEDSLIRLGASPEEWNARLNVLLTARAAFSRAATEFAASFTSQRSAQRILDLAAHAAELRDARHGRS